MTLQLILHHCCCSLQSVVDEERGAACAELCVALRPLLGSAAAACGCLEGEKGGESATSITTE